MAKQKPKTKPLLEKSEANKYDKILKENLIKAMGGIMNNVLGLDCAQISPLNPDLQHTSERKADFIGLVEEQSGEKVVVHIEFQLKNETKMRHRMLEYKAMLLRRFPNFRIRQYVVFLGNNRPTMLSVFDLPDLSYRFNLAWFRGINANKFLESENPEEVILAVLADFGNMDSEQVAEAIFESISSKSATELEFQRYSQQLRILSNIRNLQPLIEKLMEKVSRFFVESRDPLFKKGKLEGELAGMQKGMLKGMQEAKKEGKIELKIEKQNMQRQFVINLLNDGSHSLSKVAALANVSLAFVKEIKAELDQEAPQ